MWLNRGQGPPKGDCPAGIGARVRVHVRVGGCRGASTYSSRVREGWYHMASPDIHVGAWPGGRWGPAAGPSTARSSAAARRTLPKGLGDGTARPLGTALEMGVA